MMVPGTWFCELYVGLKLQNHVKVATDVGSPVTWNDPYAMCVMESQQVGKSTEQLANKNDWTQKASQVLHALARSS